MKNLIKPFALVLSLIIILSVIPITYATAADYKLIQNADDLYAINSNLSGHYILAHDIDLSSFGNWTPVGSSAAPFTGILDGNGYEIKNLSVDLTQNIPDGDVAINAALFNVVSGGTIKNLGITNASINNYMIGSKSSELSFCNASGFAGELLNGSLIEKCYFIGSVSSETCYNSFARSSAFANCVNSTIRNCYADINISAKADYANTMVGGIASWNDSTTVDKCYVEGTLYAQNTNSLVYAGGIVGSGNGIVSNSVCLLSSFKTDGKTSVDNTGTVTVDTICPFSTLTNNAVLSSLASSINNKSAVSVSSTLSKDVSTYASRGWDFSNVWNIDNNYPTLKQTHIEYAITPYGYDFNDDSYSFENYSDTIDLEYFKSMYGNAKGFTLWKSKRNAGGVCYGMAITTAALYNDMPQVDRIRSLINASDGLFSISSDIKINNKYMSIRDYIGYAYIYQYSTHGNISCIDTTARELYNTVKSYTDRNEIAVTVRFVGGAGNHLVLAVGYEGNNILIDDPNNAKSLEKIIINEDGSWSFTGYGNYNSTNTALQYQTNYNEPYNLLTTATSVEVGSWYDSDTSHCFVGMDKVDEEKYLLSVDSDEFVIDSKNIYEITDSALNEAETSDNHVFWVDEDCITVSDISGSENLIEFADNDSIISANVSDASKITLSFESDSEAITIDSLTGKAYSFSFTDCDDENSVELTISGAADGSEITAIRNSNTINIDGINNGKITLTVNDEIVNEQDLKESDVIISYDNTGTTNDINVKTVKDDSKKVESVIINDVTLNYKSNSKINADISGNCEKYTVEYKSSNSAVVSVDNDGNIYACKRGTAEISCVVTDEAGHQVSDTCNVTVNYTWWQWIIKIVLFGWIWY